MFTAALADLLDELARDIAADGEGATKRLEVHVAGAPTDDIARDLAKSICGSPLVKAAIFGADPNWGRDPRHGRRARRIARAARSSRTARAS